MCESYTNRMLVAGLTSGEVVVLEPDTLQKRRTFDQIQRDIGSGSIPFIDRSIVSQNGRILIRKNSHTSFGSWDLVAGILSSILIHMASNWVKLVQFRCQRMEPRQPPLIGPELVVVMATL